MGRRLSQADALARFRETHGDRYEYSQVEYVHSMTKVVVICREHGPFAQAPSSHWNGQGCPRCARSRQTGAPPQPWAEVERRLIEVHNGRYTYDGTGYEDTNSKIKATCPEHGDFWPQVASHLRGKFGCRKCSYLERGQAKRLSFKAWLQRSREKFGYQFHYDPWSWDTHTNIRMKRLRLQCPEHGWQETNPVNHLNSPLGCPTCGNFLAGDKRRLTTEEFITRARAQHGVKYSYEKTVYRNSDEKLIVTCPEHGDFWTLPHNHMKGTDCARCAGRGFDPELPGTVYYIRVDAPHGVFYKIGITNHSVWDRYPSSEDQARITVLREWWYEMGVDAVAHEKVVLRDHKEQRHSGEPVLRDVGVTEVFACDVLGLDGGDPPKPPQLSLFD